MGVDEQGHLILKRIIELTNQGNWVNYEMIDNISDAIGINMDTKQALIDLAERGGNIGIAGEKYLEITKNIGRATGILGAGLAWKDYFENRTTGGLIKALGTSGLAFARVNPFVGVGLGILDITGGSDWIYNKVGSSIDNYKR